MLVRMPALMRLQQQSHRQQCQAVIKMVLHRGFEHAAGVIVQPALEGMRAESAQGDCQHAADRCEGDEELSHGCVL